MVSSHEDYEGSYGNARHEEGAWYPGVVNSRAHMDKVCSIQFDCLTEDWALFDHYLSYPSDIMDKVQKGLTCKISS